MSSESAALTVGDWFARVQPAPPRALAEQLATIIASESSLPASHVPEVCMRLAEKHLLQLLESGSTSRATAVDLLAVDALVTYAFEAAAGDPAQMEHRAKDAMSRIGALAAQAHAQTG